MSNRCSSCQHTNPSDAKYCNECGGTLGLKQCHRCDAVNDAHAARCYACGIAFSNWTAAAITTTKSTAQTPTSSSVLHALETIEADLATLEQVEELRAHDVHHARDATKSTNASAPTTASASRIGERTRDSFVVYAKRSMTSHALRPLLVASLVLAFSAGIVRSDQQSSVMQSPAMASLAGPAFIADASDAAMIPGRHRSDMRSRDVPRFHAASSSPRAISGAITDASASAAAQGALMRNALSDAISAIVSPQATPETTRSVAATPAAGMVAAAHPSTTKPPVRHAEPARAYTAMSDKQTSTTPQPRAPLWSDERAFRPAESLTYPVAANNCTQSVAALGLCRSEGIDRDQ